MFNCKVEIFILFRVSFKLNLHLQTELGDDRKLAKMQKYLRHTALIAVLFDKGVGFCVVKKSTYAEKLEEVLYCEQFRKIERSCDNIVTKNEKQLKKKLLDLRKKEKITVKIYEA